MRLGEVRPLSSASPPPSEKCAPPTSEMGGDVMMGVLPERRLKPLATLPSSRTLSTSVGLWLKTSVMLGLVRCLLKPPPPGLGMLMPLPSAYSEEERPKCFPCGAAEVEPGVALMLRNSFMLSCSPRRLADTSAWGTAVAGERMPGRWVCLPRCLGIPDDADGLERLPDAPGMTRLLELGLLPLLLSPGEDEDAKGLALMWMLCPLAAALLPLLSTLPLNLLGRENCLAYGSPITQCPATGDHVWVHTARSSSSLLTFNRVFSSAKVKK